MNVSSSDWLLRYAGQFVDKFNVRFIRDIAWHDLPPYYLDTQLHMFGE